MSLIYQWSTIANDNGTLGSYPNYWPEGQPPSSVNNCARLMMSSIRTQWNDAQWFNWGYTVARVSGTSFSVITASWNTVTLPAAFEANARIKLYDTSTIYGTITTVSASAASTLVTFTPDSGSLTASFSSVYNSILSPTNTSIPVVVTPGSVIPGNNMVVNGDFQIWQRGAGGAAAIAVPASTVAYTADRWQLQTFANQDCVVSQQSGTTSGSFFATIQRTAGQTGASPINFLTSLTRSMCVGAAGNKVTLSFYAASSANYSPAASALDVIVTTGTGTTDTSALTPWTGTAAQSTTVTLTTSLTKFSFTTAVLASNVTQIAATFKMTPVGTAGVADAFIVTDVQLEISPQATAFERLNFNEQLQACLPFYQKSFNYNQTPIQNAGNNTGEYFYTAVAAAAGTNDSPSFTLPTQLNGNSTPGWVFSLYNPGDVTAGIYNETRAQSCSGAGLIGATIQRSFAVSCTGSAATQVGDRFGFHYTLEAELV